jgi:hypothetical protein
LGLFPPALFPLTFHWKVGEVPPFVITAVNVTLVPVQTLLAEAVICTLTESGLKTTTLKCVGCAAVHPFVSV